MNRKRLTFSQYNQQSPISSYTKEELIVSHIECEPQSNVPFQICTFTDTQQSDIDVERIKLLTSQVPNSDTFLLMDEQRPKNIYEYPNNAVCDIFGTNQDGLTVNCKAFKKT